MSSSDHETFETITRRAEDLRRAESIDDYGNEIAGRNTGRMSRHLPGEEAARKDAQKRDEAAQRILSALDQLLLDPEYRARYESFGVFLGNAELRADALLRNAEKALADITEELEDMLDNANRLPDGRRVFRMEDGRVIDEDGNLLKPEEAESIVWKPGAPTGEAYLDAKARKERAEQNLLEITRLRNDLGEVRDRYDDHGNPLAKGEMDAKQTDIDGRLNGYEKLAPPEPEIDRPDGMAVTQIAKPVI